SNVSVTAAGDGAFWIAFDTTEGVYRATPGGMARAADGFVSHLLGASDGAVWFTRRGASAGITRLAADGATATLLPQSLVTGLAAGRDGTMWVAADGGLLHVPLSGDVLSRTDVYLGPFPALAATADGGVCVSALNSDRITMIDASGTATGSVSVPRLPLFTPAGLAMTLNGLYVSSVSGD